MQASHEAHVPFQSPDGAIGPLNGGDAANLISAMADIAIVVDGRGLVRDVTIGAKDLLREDYRGWLGKPWIETVALDSRPKVEQLLRDARKGGPLRWRHINYPSGMGEDVPVRYSAISIGDDDHVVAIGRDLRVVAGLQQRLADAQQEMEREYARLRSAETRYQVLFQITSEAVVIADAANLRVSEANPAALRLLGMAGRRATGLLLADLFAPGSQPALQSLLLAARGSGRSTTQPLTLAASGAPALVSLSLFRHESAAHVLMRLASPSGAVAAKREDSLVGAIIDRLPDGFAVTDDSWRILSVNAAFLDLVQLPNEMQARARTLEDFIGAPGVDFRVLTANLRQNGSVRHFTTFMRNTHGGSEKVEVTAVAVPDDREPCYGFTFRTPLRRSAAPGIGAGEMPRSVEQLTELVGRVSLKDLVRESTDMIEKFAIEAALQLTGDNRASAADMLGLSRQSLYVKLRRYGLGDLEGRMDG